MMNQQKSKSQRVIPDIIAKNAAPIERLDREIAKREHEESKEKEKETNEEVTEHQVLHKETKCRYFNKGFCKYRKKCRYGHPKEVCDTYLNTSKCENSKCPKRHPEVCKFWREKSGSCKRNERCDFLHVTLVNEMETSSQIYKCVGCKNEWEDKSCVVEHMIRGHKTFFCLNCEDWVKMKTNVYDANWTLFDEWGYLRQDV